MSLTAFLERFLGANWRTTLSGYVALLAGAIVADPTLVAGLPDAWQTNLISIAKLIAAIGAGTFVLNAKDKQVTGGAVQQPEPVVPRPAGTAVPALVAILIPAIWLAGCATDTGNPSKDRAGRVTNAILTDVAKSVGKAAFDELTAQGDNSGPGHSAAQGLWVDGLTKASVILISSGTLSDIINAWSGSDMPSTASAAAKAFTLAAPVTVADQQAVISTIATAISHAATSVSTP